MSEANDNHEIEDLLRARTEAEVPPEVEACLRRYLADFRERMEQAETPQMESLIMIALRSAAHGRTGWAAAAAVAIAVVALVVSLNPWGGEPTGQAYAAVVQQIRTARTMTFTMTAFSDSGGIPSTTNEMMFKEPGLSRMSGQGTIGVTDYVTKKGIVISTSEKEYIEMDFSNMPALEDQSEFNAIDDIRTLPDRADTVIGEKELDGRTVRGFQVKNDGLRGMDSTVWVDVETGDLARIDGEIVNAEGLRVTMTDFRFDVDLADSLFSLTPPEGYSPRNIQVPSSLPSEEDLIVFLRFWAERHPEELFPPSVNPVEIAKHAKRMESETDLGEKERELGKKWNEMTEDERIQRTMEVTQGAMFALMMKPENDWHYAGEGVRLGDADTAVCWYRPTGESSESETGSARAESSGTEIYRVIYGDLSVREVSAEERPEARGE